MLVCDLIFIKANCIFDIFCFKCLIYLDVGLLVLSQMLLSAALVCSQFGNDSEGNVRSAPLVLSKFIEAILLQLTFQYAANNCTNYI